jgi:hypothetical protein
MSSGLLVISVERCAGKTLIFDALFARACKHVMAINQANHALPFEAILLAMLVELMHDVLRLQEQVDR